MPNKMSHVKLDKDYIYVYSDYFSSFWLGINFFFLFFDSLFSLLFVPPTETIINQEWTS